MRTLILSFCVFIFALSLSAHVSAGQIELAAGDPATCLKACVEQNGADQKKSCALQCGYGQGNLGKSGQARDCGTEYKRCLAACQPNDKDCRKGCRQARTSCY